MYCYLCIVIYVLAYGMRADDLLFALQRRSNMRDNK